MGPDAVTNPPKTDAAAQPELGFMLSHKELLAVRVRPAEFARLLGVSKQTVSIWIRDGKVTINALDGLLDVRRAIQDVLRNTDPGRLRSRVLRQAVTDALDLRQNLARAEDRAEAAEAALLKALTDLEHWKKWADDGDRCMEIFKGLIVDHADALRDAPDEAWPAMLADLEDTATLAADPADDAELADFLNASEASGAIHEAEGGGGNALAEPKASTTPAAQDQGDGLLVSNAACPSRQA